jgi:hypothetical protein
VSGSTYAFITVVLFPFFAAESGSVKVLCSVEAGTNAPLLAPIAFVVEVLIHRVLVVRFVTEWMFRLVVTRTGMSCQGCDKHKGTAGLHDVENREAIVLQEMGNGLETR